MKKNNINVDGNMLLIFQLFGIFDAIKTETGSLKHYKKKLHEYQEHEADTLIDLGVLYLDDDELDNALGCFQEAVKIYIKIGDVEGEAFALDLIGDAYLNMRKIATALEYYQNSYKLYESIESPLKNEMHDKIIEVEKIKEFFEEAEIEEESEISKTAEEDDEEYIANFDKISSKLEDVIKLLDKAHIYEALAKEEDQMSYLNEAIVTARGIGDSAGEATLLLIAGDISLKNEETNETLKNFKKAFNIFHKTRDQWGEALSLLLIGAVYFILNDKDSMYEVFKKSLDIFRKLGDKNGESVAIDLINSLYTE